MIGKVNPQLALLDSFSNGNRSTRSDRMLTTIDTLIDWDGLVEPIRATYAKTGRPSLDAVLGLKCLLLMQLYHLSYPELEEQINDRISFRRFLGLGLSDDAPDFSTFWKFRERLVEHRLYDTLFTAVVAAIEARGYLVKEGTIVDATLIDANRRMPPKQTAVDAPAEPPPPRRPQEDRDATVTKKRSRTYYGYKGHIGIDRGSGIIRKQHFTTASGHDSVAAETLISGDEFVVYGDKAYHNGRIKEYCDKRVIAFGILEQARSNRPLPHASKVANDLKEVVRKAVERTFAHLKRVHRYTRVRSVSLLRNAADFALLCIGYDLKRCTVLMERG